MNIKIKSLKKSLFSACNKLVKQQASSFDEQYTQPKRQQNTATMPTSTCVSRSISTESIGKHSLCYEEVNTNNKCDNNNFASASSGYVTTSVKSALSIFVNLDNYFYDENFAKVNLHSYLWNPLKLDQNL